MVWKWSWGCQFDNEGKDESQEMWDVWGDNDSEEDEPEIEDNAGVDEESENVEGIATAPKADENDIRDRNFVEEVLHLCLYMHHTHMTKQCVWLEERLMTMWTKEKLRKLVWKLQMRLRGNKQRTCYKGLESEES